MASDAFNAASAPEYKLPDLLSAIEKKDAALTAAILASGQVPIEAAGEDGWTPLYRAMATGETAFVKQVLDAGAKVEIAPSYVDHNGYTPLAFAITYYRSTPAIFALILAAGAKIDTPDSARDGKMPIELAVKRNDEQIVETLLQRGADPNQQIWHGETVVHLAAKEGYGEIIRLLKAYGGDLDRRGQFLSSPLDKALQHQHREAFEVLVELGANVEQRFDNPRYDNRSTLLMSAAIAGETGVIDFLIGKGYDVNYQNKEGKTALHYAANVGRAAAVRRLLELGADPNLKTEEGSTARQLAEIRGNTHIMGLIDQKIQDTLKAGTGAAIKPSKPFRITLGGKHG
ncbi:MAG: ankyrin repeat domain-containing protein [Alphaproteobacteria bacterium]